MGPNAQNADAATREQSGSLRLDRRRGAGAAPRAPGAPRPLGELRGRGYLRADLAGQFASLLFGILGLFAILRSLIAETSETRMLVLLCVGLVAGGVSVAGWFLPWHRILPRGALVIELFAFGVIAVTNWADPNPLTYGVMFGVVFVWIGLVRPITATGLAVAPATVAYLAPMVLDGAPPGWWLGVASTVSVSALIGMALAAGGEQLRRAELYGRRRVTGLESILHSTVELAQPLEPETVVAMTADIGMRAFAGDAVVLLGASDVVDTFRVLDQRHWNGVTRGAALRCDPEVSAKLCAGEYVVLQDGMLSELPSMGGESHIMPLTAGGHLVGAIVVWWRWSLESDARRIDADLATVFAQQAGSALERAYAFGELQSATMHDALTGLGNRRAADRMLEALEPGDAVVMIDLDHFKRVNDDFGHPAGDKALRELGAFLASSLRDGDRVARYGGEEFIMFVRKIHPAAVESLLERLRLLWNERDPITTFSIGAAVHPGGVDPRVTLQAADIALYQAKERGRDRVVVAA